MPSSAASAREIVLDYADGRWRARADGLDLAHEDLAALDRLIEHELAARGVVRARVRFDTSGLPVWLRQYHAHYFNYELAIGGRAHP